MKIEIKSPASRLPEQLRELSSRISSKSYGGLPLSLAEMLADSTRENLASGGSGLGWAPLEPTTLAIRRKRGYDGKPPLERRGDLIGSISAASDGTVLVGVGWASVLHLGGFSEGLGKGTEIPARPFLTVNDAAQSRMTDALAEHFLERL